MFGWLITGLLYIFMANVHWRNGNKAKSCAYYLIGIFCCVVFGVRD